ncbi:MAG: hypothetical protein E7054_03205 [Lentisphaerae bacterium]|nr:hypothetical protein [Lentisphaerota bacterium]
MLLFLFALVFFASAKNGIAHLTAGCPALLALRSAMLALVGAVRRRRIPICTKSDQAATSERRDTSERHVCRPKNLPAAAGEPPRRSGFALGGKVDFPEASFCGIPSASALLMP